MIGKASNSQIRPYAAGMQYNASIYGATIPAVYGTIRIPAMLTWARNLRESADSGKKKKSWKPLSLMFSKKERPSTYFENVDYLLAHNPCMSVLQMWSNKQKLPYAFTVYSTVITPGDPSTITIPDSNFAFLLGVTLTQSYDVTIDDYGSGGPVTFTGSYEIPLWNAAYAGPNPTDPSAYRYYPYTYRSLNWNSSFKLDHLPTGELPGGTLKAYYAQLTTLPENYASNFPSLALRLTTEQQLGDGPEFAGFESQRILYPHYFGLGSADIDLGTAASLPQFRAEVYGAFPVYSRGDADFADIVEDILAGAQAQAGFEITPARTDVYHGLNCVEYPGVTQKGLFIDAGGLEGAVLPYDIPNTAGNFLVVIAPNSTGISDGAGNAWTDRGNGIWTATAVAAIDNTVTLAGGGIGSVELLEVAGVDTIDSVVTGTNGVSVTTTNMAQSPALILALTRYLSSPPPGIPALPLWKNVIANTALTEFTQSRIVYNPGAYALTNAGSPTAMVLIAFKASEPPSYPRPFGDIIDRETMDVARAACRAYGLWGSMSMDSQKKAGDWLDELFMAMNCAPVWSGFRLKVIPYAEQSAVGNGAIYTAPTTSGPIANLLESDFIGDLGKPMITVEHQALQVDVPNILQFEHPNRDSDYNRVVTSQPDQAAIALAGPRKESPQAISCIVDASIARLILGAKIRRQNYVRDLYKFMLNPKWNLLEPMDLVTVTDLQVGINQLPVRLTKVEENDDFALACEAEPFVYGSGSPNAAQSVVTSPNSNPQDTGATPGPVNAPIIFQPIARLSNQQSQLWVVVSNSDPDYGGCLVYISTDGGASYSPLGSIQGNAVTGETVGAWPAAADPDTTNDLAVDLTESLGALESFSMDDEDNFIYPCYVEGGAGTIPYELIAYAVANLTSAYHYTIKAT